MPDPPEIYASDADRNPVDEELNIDGRPLSELGAAPSQTPADVARTWRPQKHPDNPLIQGTAESDNSYPPTVIRVDGIYYCIVKSNPYLWGFSSTDGETWTDEGQVLAISQGWESNKLSYPVVRYDPGPGTYHLYYTAGGKQKKLGHATSSNPLSGYSKDSNNPILTSSDIDSALGWTDCDTLHLGDVVRYGATDDSRETETLYYGVAHRSSSQDTLEWQLFVATDANGDGFAAPEPRNLIFSGFAHPREGTVLQCPELLRHNGSLMLLYTVGHGRGTEGERGIYAAKGGPYNWTPVSGKVLGVGPSGSWEDRRVYDSVWLKKQDGEYLTADRPTGSYRLYYSGHPTDVSAGWTGLAEYDRLPDVSEKPAIQRSRVSLGPSDSASRTFTNTATEVLTEEAGTLDAVAAQLLVWFGNQDGSTTEVSLRTMDGRFDRGTIRSGLGTVSTTQAEAFGRSQMIDLRAGEGGQVGLEASVSAGTGELFSATLLLYETPAD